MNESYRKIFHGILVAKTNYYTLHRETEVQIIDINFHEYKAALYSAKIRITMKTNNKLIFKKNNKYVSS
jgi:hypothetical protein